MDSVYKEYADQLTYPIKNMTASLEIGKLPEGTAQAFTTRIYKGGVKSNSGNYRPVASANHFTKIFERILVKSMVEYFESNEVMDPTQYRLRHKRSAISPILSFYEDIISKVENGNDVDAIYLDF